MTDLGAALFLAPDGYGRLRVWQEIDGYPAALLLAALMAPTLERTP